MLQAQLIRNLTRQVLTDATDAGPRVYGSPILPLRRDRPLPALSVYTLNDAQEPLGESGPYQLRHHLDIVIEAVTELATDPSQTADDRLQLDACAPVDALVEQVKETLYPNPLWYGALKLSPIHRIVERREFANIIDSDRRTAAAIITLTVVYDEIFEPNPPDFFYLGMVGVDMIKPFNPNLAPIGPDGQIDVTVRIPTSGTLWLVTNRTLEQQLTNRARQPPLQ
jgi:hypothetical protein